MGGKRWQVGKRIGWIKILRDVRAEALEEEVAQYLEHGWELVGPVQVSSSSAANSKPLFVATVARLTPILERGNDRIG